MTENVDRSGTPVGISIGVFEVRLRTDRISMDSYSNSIRLFLAPTQRSLARN
jgi:hypothetical protein